MSDNPLRNWRRLRLGDLDALRRSVSTGKGQATILAQVATIVDDRRDTSVAALEETYLLGVQLRSVWPPAAASTIDIAINFRRMSEHAVAFMCGFVGRTFEDAADIATGRIEVSRSEGPVWEIESLAEPHDHIAAYIASAA